MHEICQKYAQICRSYAVICQKYAINMHKICKYIDCISRICKKYAVKICRNIQFYMQNMHKLVAPAGASRIKKHLKLDRINLKF